VTGLGPTAGSGPAALRTAALEVLLDPALRHCVDLVAYRDGPEIEVCNADGVVRLGLADPSSPGTVRAGRDPLANQDPLAYTPLAAELADPSPPNARNSYPDAGRRLASLFADPRAPDLAVVHTGRHYWPERGGHRGEHGSLSVVQSRAPLVLAGPGVAARGILARSARVVDIAPTMARLAGVPAAALAALDGRALHELAEPGPAGLVVGLLWDGANSNSLLGLAADGELPAVRRMLDAGLALLGGAVAEFPSVTLVNHACAITGLGPGRHGIVHNAFYDRATRTSVVANDAVSWHAATRLLRPGSRTVFELAGGAGTACVNEPVDRGADYSTFAIIRAGSADGAARPFTERLPDPRGDPHATREHVESSPDYAWSTQVDAAGLEQALALLGQDPPPRLIWWNSTLPDSGHHAGGPHTPIAQDSLRDTDRRLGVFLDELERRGLADRALLLLTADHGSEPADPECRGDWD
jgi:hypothetical protein